MDNTRRSQRHDRERLGKFRIEYRQAAIFPVRPPQEISRTAISVSGLQAPWIGGNNGQKRGAGGVDEG